MRVARLPDGEKRFDFKSYLRPRQIKAHFSKIAAALKYGSSDPSDEQIEEVSLETQVILQEQATTEIMENVDQVSESELLMCPLEVKYNYICKNLTNRKYHITLLLLRVFIASNTNIVWPVP